MNKEERWQFLSGIQYAGQYFIIEIRPHHKPSGEFYMDSRTKEVTKEEILEAQNNSTLYYSKL